MNRPDSQILMTLDAGGTNFRFSAIRANKAVTATVTMPSHGDNLKKCLASIIEGFTQIKKQCAKPPVAISFAFPGPADHPAGKGETRTITVPGGKRKIKYDALQRIGVGVSGFGTSEAVAIGAYTFVLQKLGAK